MDHYICDHGDEDRIVTRYSHDRGIQLYTASLKRVMDLSSVHSSHDSCASC